MKSSKPLAMFSILVFLFCLYNFFPQQPRLGLIKINKSQEADITSLDSTRIKVVQELQSCFIAYVRPGFSSKLSQAGFSFEYLDQDARGKKYFLVYCPLPGEMAALEYYGKARPIEENVALFSSDGENAREVLPARFQMASLPEEPLRSFKKRPLTEALQPEIELPSKLEANPVILEIVDKVSEQNLRNSIQSLQDFQTRYASTANCNLAGDFIYDYFIQTGLKAEYAPFSFATYYNSNNIIGTLEGAVDPEQVVIICAHYDSISTQPLTLAPGADDNASGVAAVMEASRIMADYSFDFSVKFICFSAEEWGLYGSQDYAQKAGQRRENIIAVVNLDMIAYTDFLPEDLDIISNPASEWLANRFSLTSMLYTPLDILKIVNSSFIWSDHSSFWNRGYSAIIGIEDYDVPNPYYHTTQDTIDKLNFDFIVQAVKASLATLADLAQSVSTPRTPTGLVARSQIISSLFSSRKTIFLNWNNNQDQVIGYNIYRTETPHSDYRKLNDIPLVQASYADGNLDPDAHYIYVVTAVDSLDRESNYSREVMDNGVNESDEFKQEMKSSGQKTLTLSGGKKRIKINILK